MPSKSVAIVCVVWRPMLSSAWLTISFCIASWLVGTLAMRPASRSTASSSSSAGTASITSPHSRAGTPSMVPPVSSIRFARSAPSRYTHIAVVGHPQTLAGM